MSHKEYYTEDLEKLRNRVSKCSTQVLDSLEFFLEEANTYSAGISDDIVNKIKDDVKKFKKNCMCKSSLPKKLEEIETAEEFIMTGYKR